MKKRAVIFTVAVIMLFQTVCIFPTATENDPWTFIDGENIHRQVNTAVIYRGVDSTGQDRWGCNIIIGADGIVSAVSAAGDSESEDIAVPEGGAVISASGTAASWFEDRIDVGDSVYYDSYTQRLFLVNGYGGFDPFISKEFEVSGEGEAYLLTNPEISGTPQYTYDIAVDADHTVVARGTDVTLPEGGFILSAATKADMKNLIMYAPLGASCSISEGMATFSYKESMLSETAELALDNARSALEAAKNAYLDIDCTSLEALIAECGSADKNSYEAVFELADKLEDAVYACTDNEISELRAAVHAPDETSDTLVRATVLKAKAAGLNTIILKVSNGYGTFIPLPEDLRFQQDESFGGFDVLRSYIDICAEEGMALSLCIDVYYNAYASVAATDWLSSTNGGTKGISSKYFSPYSQEFKSWFLSYVEYIVTHYNISTLMFDYLRYPKFSENGDLGYDYPTLQGFSDVSGIPITEVEDIKTELFDSPHWEKWVEYRMGLINDMAVSLSEKVRELRPDITLLTTAERDNVSYYYMQDTAKWVSSGLFDGICQLFYTADVNENDPLPEMGLYDSMIADKGETLSVYTGRSAYFFIGLDSSADSAHNGDVITKAVADTRALGTDGFVFSDLNGYISQNYASVLESTVLRKDAVSPFYDTAEAMKQILEYSKEKINSVVLAKEGCDDVTAEKAAAKIDEAISLLETEALTYEQAQTLESDIAALFAASGAKASVVKDLESLTKLALLAKEAVPELTPPDGGTSVESSSPSDGSQTEQSSGMPLSESSADVSSDLSEPQSSRIEFNIDFGNVLIHGFVGVTLAAAVAATVISFRRRKKRPAHSHMPKAGRRPEPEEDAEE